MLFKEVSVRFIASFNNFCQSQKIKTYKNEKAHFGSKCPISCFNFICFTGKPFESEESRLLSSRLNMLPQG